MLSFVIHEGYKVAIIAGQINLTRLRRLYIFAAMSRLHIPHQSPSKRIFFLFKYVTFKIV